MTEEPTITYYWKIHFRQDKQGFQKYFEVVAPDIFGALEDGVRALEEQGYNQDDFAAVSVQRIREVGT